MSVVLDASALLAYLHTETGGERVGPMLEGARVSAVNWSEVVQKALQRDVCLEGMQQALRELGVIFEPFTARQAEIAAQLFQPTRILGLSLADRACLALALDFGLPVVTADRAWSQLKLDIEIETIR